MKSKISLFNQAVFKKNLTSGWVLWAGLLVLYILGIPVSMYGVLSEMSHFPMYNPESNVALSAVFQFTMITNVWFMLRTLVPIFAIAALFCAMHVFSYLFAARNSNMMHTYPVSRVSLFLTNFVSGILYLFVPLAAAAVLTLAVGASKGAVNAEVLKYYGIWLVVVLIENLFFFSMAVCVLMFVGNIIAVPALYLILNFLYEGCLFIAESMAQVVCYGLDNQATLGGFGVLTPMIYLRRVGIQYENAYENPGYTLQRIGVLPGYLAAAVLFAVIALVVYQKKHIETAGDVITVNWLKPIFRWGMALCTASLGALLLRYSFYSKSFVFILGSVAVIGMIVFFIAQMLLDRSIHVFTKRKIQECLLYTAVVCGCYFALDLDVAGLERKIPDADEIQAVLVQGGIQLLATEEEEISWVRDIHRQIIDAKKEFEHRAADKTEMTQYTYTETTQYTYFEYLLKDNSILRRRYEVPMDEEKESVYGQIMEYAGRKEVILKELFGIHYPEIEVYGGRWNTADTTAWGEEDPEISMQNDEIRISEADAKQLYEAIKQDVESGNVLADGRDTAAGIQCYGNLILEVRDEAGFLNVSNYGAISNYREHNLPKDGKTTIYVSDKFTCLLEKMRELGYLPKEES